ncbi:MAG TPA: ZIP family metal transporter [Clostridia bacterium]|jgi:zinc transporter ZupT|nr:MAG: zinc transporter ZupT [Firmicutes bacterium ADurb.Bin146]HOD92282.1 ZIP family metal transporter [Clostridia bacterium]HQM38721.1 ZIP family metal transporter [Clostridia bacterium]
MDDRNVFLMISIFAASALLVNSIGIYVVYKNKNWVEKYKEYFLCFAAGVLISAPLISAFPEAIEKNHNAGFAALIGFVFMLFTNRLIKHHTHQDELAFGITTIQGIGIHSLLDGITYTVTFSTSLFTGLASGIGLVIHEFTEGVITFSVLLRGGVSAKKSMFFAFLVAGLTTPIGAFVAYPLIKRLNDSTLGLALGFVVGVLIYISAAHLLPEAKTHEKKHSLVALCLGIALSVGLSFFHHH